MIYLADWRPLYWMPSSLESCNLALDVDVDCNWVILNLIHSSSCFWRPNLNLICHPLDHEEVQNQTYSEMKWHQSSMEFWRCCLVSLSWTPWIQCPTYSDSTIVKQQTCACLLLQQQSNGITVYRCLVWFRYFYTNGLENFACNLHLLVLIGTQFMPYQKAKLASSASKTSNPDQRDLQSIIDSQLVYMSAMHAWSHKLAMRWML